MKFLISFVMSFLTMWGMLEIFCNDRGSAGPDLLEDAPPSDDTPSDDTPPAESAVAWPEGLDDNYKNEGMFKPFIDQDKKIDVVKLAKSYYHTKKDMGRDKITVPNENTTQEEWDKIHEKLFGVGPSIESYNFTLDKEKNAQLDDEFVNNFKSLAHELRIPVNSAVKLAEFVNNRVESGLSDLDASTKAESDAKWEAVRKEWGEAYNQRVTSATRFITDNAPQEFKDFLTKTGLNKSPEIFKFFGDFATNYYKEGFIPNNKDGSGDIHTPAEAGKKINEIMADKTHPYWNKRDPRHKDAMNEMKKLHQLKKA